MQSKPSRIDTFRPRSIIARPRAGRGALALAWVLGAGALMGVVAPTTAHAEVPTVGKVALVDMQRVLDETVEGKAAKKTLEESSKRKMEKLQTQRTRLENMQAKLSKMAPGPDLDEAAARLEQDYYDLQAMYMTMQQELQESEAKTLEDIYKKCAVIVADLAKTGGIDLVLVRDESTVLYVKDGLDLTTEVIKLYDKKAKAPARGATP